MLECEKDDDEEGCMNMVTGEDEAPNKDKGWGTLDSSWLDLKEENEGKTFHVNVIIEEVTVPGLEIDRWKYCNSTIPEICCALRFFLFIFMCLVLVLTKF